MKKYSATGALAFVLAVVMLVSLCVIYVGPGGLVALEADAAETESQYALGMTASINETDSSLIDVVITAKDFKQELVAAEFLLNFDKTLVEGVVTENDQSQMDVFMTRTPTYIFSYGGMETAVPSFEQLCYYDGENARYECRFCDLLDYPHAKAGQEIHGLVNDGDLEITIQFRILEGVAPGTEIAFSATNVLGTTTIELNSVPGTGATAVVTIADSDSEPETDPDSQYTLDMTASINEADSSLIDVVITAKNFKQELIASEFLLNFDKTLVEGVVTENDQAQMDVFMTRTPTYLFSYGGMETAIPSFEQICYYDGENARYECRFCDLLDYPHAKAGQEIRGLVNDGDLEITIQFRILEGVAPGTKIEFSATNVKGTTTIEDGINSVPGTGDTASVSTVAAPALFDISFASMTMGNSLAINFAFEKGHVADWTGHYAEIVKEYADGRENVVQTVQLSGWKSTNINGIAHYYVTFNGIAAKEMTDNVYVTIYNAEGEAVSNTWTDSVRAQAMRNLAKATIGAEEKTMVVDMLNYGAAAQQEFQYNTADLATAQLSEEQKALATESTTYEDAHVGTGNYVASNLMLKSNIQLMFAFRNVTSDMKAVVTFTNHRGVAKNITIEGTEFTKSGSLSIVTVEDMVVADSRQDITCTIYDGETVVAAITDSAASYAARKNNNLFEMLMRFSDSAYAYFH